MAWPRGGFTQAKCVYEEDGAELGPGTRENSPWVVVSVEWWNQSRMRLWERREINRNGRQVTGRFSEKCPGVDFLWFCVREEESGHLQRKCQKSKMSEVGEWGGMQERQLIDHLCLGTLSPGLVWWLGTQLQMAPRPLSPLPWSLCEDKGTNPDILLWHSQCLFRKSS